jgi:hypothetical protein
MRFAGVSTLLASAAVAAAVACNDPFAVTATISNTIDTLELFDVLTTPVTQPSGYVITLRARTRPGLDQPVYNFDFLFRIDPVAGPQFVPYGAVARGDSVNGRSGFLPTTLAFDAITIAEQTGYQTSQPVDLTVGQVLYVRSAVPNSCFLGIPNYAKLEVLSIDIPARSVRFRILVDINCGYRGLEPGVPKQ